MGTLTGGQPRLPEYCEHKLPTSCRLTSIPNCCACADERAHSASYNTYIDGIGFVPYGNRWQRYCWFCKEFWEARVRISELRPGQTRVPEVPDQTEFLERWYEFHRGYRVVDNEDGSEERVAVLGEDFKEVSPGYLPRTVEEMRRGLVSSELRQPVQRLHSPGEGEQAHGPSLEETLDQLYQDASQEEIEARHETADTMGVNDAPRQLDRVGDANVHAQAMTAVGRRNSQYPTRDIASLNRELQHLRNRLDGLVARLCARRGEVSGSTETTDSLAEIGRTLDVISRTPLHEVVERDSNNVNNLGNSSETSQADRTFASIQASVGEARNHVNEARRASNEAYRFSNDAHRAREQAASELNQAETALRTSQQRLQRLQGEQRSTENYIRIFGTREEILAQGDDYESPIGGMFTRAWDRFSVAEEVRREARLLRQISADDEHPTEVVTRTFMELESRDRDAWGVPQPLMTRRSRTPNSDISRRLPQLSQSTSLGQQQPRPHNSGDEHDAGIISNGEITSRGVDDGPSLNLAGLDDEIQSLRPNSDADVGTQEHIAATAQMINQEGQEANNLFPDTPLSRIQAEGTLSMSDHRRINPAELEEPIYWNLQGITHIMKEIIDNPQMCQELDHELGTNMQANILSGDGFDTDLMHLLIKEPEVIWRTMLPSAWLARRTDDVQGGRSPELWINTEALAQHPTTVYPDYMVSLDDINAYMRAEVAAQSFTFSREIRSYARSLNSSQRLQMCYRLQAGHRSLPDRNVLESLMQDMETWDLIVKCYYDLAIGETEAQTEARRRVDAERREMARYGNHSREELDASRRAAMALAITAGRQAMETGPQALMEQMTNRDEGYRASTHHFRANVRLLSQEDRLSSTDLPSDTESTNSDDEEARGLDVPGSGRPDPKTDEEMQVSMECKICYSQIAEIACLPCGHLVMCRWCSEQHSPTFSRDQTRPRLPTGCPVCRKRIRQKVRVYRA